MVGAIVDSASPWAFGVALVAGFLSFLSPCVLPLVPVYLSYVSGVGIDRLDSERSRVMRTALMFVLGFTLVFMTMGASAGSIGALLTKHDQILTFLAGIFLALSGLAMLGVVRLPERGFGIETKRGGGARALVTGVAMAIAWTPCQGPTLGSILTLAAARQSTIGGSLLLFTYAVGLALPFLAAAFAFEWVANRLDSVKRHYRVVQIVGGCILVVAGVLIASGLFVRINTYMPSFDWLSF